MTAHLYYDDAYLREFDAAITTVNKKDGHLLVALDRTAFYPGGGGQPNDTGWLTIDGRRLSVDKVRREGGQIWHQLGGMKGQSIRLAPRQRVHGELDWARRYTLMRTHTAMHILCGVVWRDYRASVTGGNMEPGKGRMDFEFAAMSADLVADIERKCNAEIGAARPVIAKVLPRDEAFRIPDLIRTKINLLPKQIAEVRTVELKGLDLQADGGTHTGNTSEVGAMRLVDYRSKGAINKRIYVEIGEIEG
jgi:misacylated tRNA(Ala) deacylase